MKTILLVHGAYGNPNENWMPWLKNELEKLKYRVIIPIFPTPENQNLENWMHIVTPHLKKLDEESIIVGHSIGATFLLSILEIISHKISSVVFVSGFVYDLGNNSFDLINNSFYNKNFNWKTITDNVKKITVFHGDDDPYVPLEASRIFAKKLKAKTTVIKGGGHLNKSAGFKEFPELLEKIICFNRRVALLVPINEKQKVLIQDRRKHKKPDWGYFGGKIEDSETPLEAVMRESKEELDIDIQLNQLKYLGATTTLWGSHKIIKYMYLYHTEQKIFNVLEGDGAYWLTFDEAQKRFDKRDCFNDLVERIKTILH